MVGLATSHWWYVSVRYFLWANVACLQVRIEGPNMQDFEGKVVVVTGAASGIGLAIAERFVEEGASVVLADASGHEVTAAAKLGERALAVSLDVTSAQNVGEVFSEVWSVHKRLDVLVNNAGIRGRMAPLADLNDEDLGAVLDVNTYGVFHCMKHALPLMVQLGGGAIVNIASYAATYPSLQCSSYAASKAAVIALTRSAAKEYGPLGIRVNAVSPGMIDTPLLRSGRSDEDLGAWSLDVPLRRIGETSEIAKVVRFLASDEASYITGVDIAVDGGRS
jgi:NAD(P)-dependent dehydrogenase (short-subunit alcohol dehydrogenase family)